MVTPDFYGAFVVLIVSGIFTLFALTVQGFMDAVSWNSCTCDKCKGKGK